MYSFLYIYTLCRHQLLSLHLHPSTAPAATSHLRYVIIESSLVEIEPLAWVPYGLLTYTYQICQLDKLLNTYCYFLFDRIASMQWSTKRNNCYPAWQTKLHQGQASPYLPATIYVCGSMCTIHQVSHRNYTIIANTQSRTRNTQTTTNVQLAPQDNQGQLMWKITPFLLHCGLIARGC